MTSPTADQQFIDLEIRILPRQDAGYPVAITLNNQQEFPRGYLSTDVLPWTSSGDSVADGQRLFDTLFADVALRSAWAEARGQSMQRRIRLHIDADAPELHALPWELLHESDIPSGTTLSANDSTPFSRYLATPTPWGGAVEQRPIRVLVVISNPKDLEEKYNLPSLNVDDERTILEQALSALDKEEISLDFLEPPVTLERIEQALQRGAHTRASGYHILHYVGHGTFGERQQQAALYLQDEEGNTAIVPDADFGEMLNRRSPWARPRLIFLAACQSATRSTADAFRGIGPKLVTAGVPAVVAMQDRVAIETARKLSLAFYRRLVEHGMVDCALNASRSLMLAAGRSDAAVPVLFMRLQSGQLWEMSDAKGADRLSRPRTLEDSTQPSRLFISYKRHADPDQKLATHLYETLTAQGHQVFIDGTMRTGETWLKEIDQQIKISDFLIVLLSKESADSEMVQAEVSRAYEYRREQGKPRTLPVRIAYEGLLPYSIAFYLSPLQYVVWQSEADNERVTQQILAAIVGQLPQKAPIQTSAVAQGAVISEDGRPVADDVDEQTPHPPLPEFDPRFLKELAVPGGAIRLSDKLYIEREADAQLKEQIVKQGTTTTIRASRQTGKTSLLMRGIHHAREQGANPAFLDFQGFGSDRQTSLDGFLHELAESICDELDLDEDIVEQAWSGSRSAPKKLTRFVEKYVLPAFDEPVILAMDEADFLLRTDFYKDFFGLLRFWHNRRASRQAWERLNIVLVISTEPYLLIDDVNQSPFNVGLRLYLEDFDQTQVRDLNRRHGSPVSETDFPRLMALLNGHPYLTRKALYTLVTKGWAWANLARVATQDQGPFGDHLRHQYWLLRDEPDLRAALKDIVRCERCEDEIAFFRLLRAGLVKGSGDVCVCRCDLYRMYFEDKL